jgi:hypothetical protein
VYLKFIQVFANTSIEVINTINFHTKLSYNTKNV